ncbi:MAG: pilus assembly protein PilZ [Moraxellaceae bacterium]|mgnify:FL=1|jgi:type IV pilus assembly protein PilZ|nr:pilus assembly protein PilZ [Moraxellaceae bacterium]
MGLPRGAGIQTLQFKDKAQLYASYMPFIKGGAIFFPTIKMPKLGDELFAVVILPDDAERMPLTSKVVWINHRTQGNRPAGFALALLGVEGDAIRRKIEAQLGGSLQSDKPTFTL